MKNIYQPDNWMVATEICRKNSLSAANHIWWFMIAKFPANIQPELGVDQPDSDPFESEVIRPQVIDGPKSAGVRLRPLAPVTGGRKPKTIDILPSS